MTKNLVPSGNNGTPYFNVRILIRDEESYGQAVLYVASKAGGKTASEEDVVKGITNYIFAKEGIVRTKDFRRIVELTKGVNQEIKEGIEKIVMRYSK